MVSIRIDRRAFYVLLAILGLGIPLGIGYLLATMVPANKAATTTTNPSTNSAAPAAVPPAADQSQPAAQTGDLAAIPRISIDEAKALHGKPDVLFYDVRTPDQYNTAHIEGAESLPEMDVVNQVDKLPKDKDLVLYCT